MLFISNPLYLESNINIESVNKKREESVYYDLLWYLCPSGVPPLPPVGKEHWYLGGGPLGENFIAVFKVFPCGPLTNSFVLYRTEKGGYHYEKRKGR